MVVGVVVGCVVVVVDIIGVVGFGRDGVIVTPGVVVIGIVVVEALSSEPALRQEEIMVKESRENMAKKQRVELINTLIKAPSNDIFKTQSGHILGTLPCWHRC